MTKDFDKLATYQGQRLSRFTEAQATAGTFGRYLALGMYENRHLLPDLTPREKIPPLTAAEGERYASFWSGFSALGAPSFEADKGRVVVPIPEGGELLISPTGICVDGSYTEAVYDAVVLHAKEFWGGDMHISPYAPLECVVTMLATCHRHGVTVDGEPVILGDPTPLGDWFDAQDRRRKQQQFTP